MLPWRELGPRRGSSVAVLCLHSYTFCLDYTYRSRCCSMAMCVARACSRANHATNSRPTALAGRVQGTKDDSAACAPRRASELHPLPLSAVRWCVLFNINNTSHFDEGDGTPAMIRAKNVPQSGHISFRNRTRTCRASVRLADQHLWAPAVQEDIREDISAGLRNRSGALPAADTCSVDWGASEHRMGRHFSSSTAMDPFLPLRHPARQRLRGTGYLPLYVQVLTPSA